MLTLFEKRFKQFGIRYGDKKSFNSHFIILGVQEDKAG